MTNNNQYKDENSILVSKTICECFEERVKLTPNSVAVAYEYDEYSFLELDELSDYLALKLIDSGVKKGTKIALYSGNCTDWVVAFLAIQKIGGVSVHINSSYSKEELEAILAYSKVEYIFCGESFKEKSLKDSLNCVERTVLEPITVIDIEGSFLQELRKLTIKDSLELNKKLQERKEEISPEDVCSMLFTSGTTSLPKGVMLTHFNLVNDAIASSRAMHWTKEDIFCVMVPLFHCFGLTSNLLSGIITGGKICLIKNFKTKYALETIEKHKCSVINGVPSMFLAMINNKVFNEYNIDSLNSGIIAGSTVFEKDYLEICKALKISHLQQSYGQTETSPGVTFSDYNDSIEMKSNNTGYALENVEICIFKPDGEDIIYDCKSLKAMKMGQKPEGILTGIHGEIGVKGFLVMKGYFEREEENKEVFDKNGFLHTGDVGYLDDRGQIYLEGRTKEIIIRGGENISPAEIEGCILNMPEIKCVKCIGIPHNILQEEIGAAIVLKDGINLNEEAVKNHVRAHMAAYKIPNHVFFLKEMPVNASGKIMTARLKEIIAEKMNKE